MSQSGDTRLQNNIKRYEALVRDHLLDIQRWRSEGFKADQIATKIGFPSRQIMYVYLRKMKEFQAAWDYGDTTLLQDLIEPAILKRSQEGFKYQEKVEELLRDSDGRPILDENFKPVYEVTKITHKVAPCNHMLQFMATKLHKERWGNKQEVEQTNDLELQEDLKDLSE